MRARSKELPEYAIAIGTLKKHAVPYFKQVPGQDCGEGIPVPSGFKPESVAVRYALRIRLGCSCRECRQKRRKNNRWAFAEVAA